MKTSRDMFYRRSHNSALQNAINLTQKGASDELFNGTAEIRKGELIINPPRGFGKYPMIMAGDNVQIFLNHQKVEYPVIVYDVNDIEIFTLDTPPRIDLEVKLSADKLKAFLKIKKIPGKKYALMDCRPMPEIKITAQCIAEYEPDPLEFDTVIQELNKKGVTFGIDEEAIRKVIGVKEQEVTIEVARGIDPTDSEDASILYNLEGIHHSEQARNPYGDGKIHSVNVGQILAIKRPPVLGKPGVDVTGQQVLPRMPKDTTIRIKDGVRLINEGTVAVATRSGRPVLDGYREKFLSVRPVYVVEGDIDLRTGNIDFNGDIVITGSVLDGFTVKAGGSIHVLGDVMHASLYANREIIVNKKVVTSKLQAGGSGVAYKRIFQILSELSQRITSLLEAMRLLKSQSAFSTLDLRQKGEGLLVQLLIDFKFKDVPKLVYRLIDNILAEKNGTIITEVLEIANLLSQNLCNLGPTRIQGEGQIEELLVKLDYCLNLVDRLIVDPADIIFGYAQNSDIKATGNIKVTGLGSIASSLDAGGQISVERGVVRGGQLIARDSIQVYELGSGQDAEVNITLFDQCILQATLARPYINIRYGSQIEGIQVFQRNLRAYVQNGRIVITSN